MRSIAICESSAEILGQLESCIGRLQSLLPDEIRCEYYMTAQAMRAGLERGEEYDILYLDMELADGDGIALGRELRGIFGRTRTVLVYLSPQSSFHRLVLETRPFEILQVPLEDTAFFRSLVAAMEFTDDSEELFLCKRGRTVHQMRKREILCLESVGRDIVLSAEGRQDLVYAGAIKKEWTRLESIRFVHPHKSFVVNLEHVEEYRARSFVLRGGKEVPISELRAKETKGAVLRFWEYRNLGAPE